MPTGVHPLADRPLRPTFVLWSGLIGGAETFTIDLAMAMRSHGADPSVVFVLDKAPLGRRLDALGIDTFELKLPRGRAVLRNPRRLAHAVAQSGADVTILVESGYLAAALRAGGYRAPVIGVEHGSLLHLDALSPYRRLVRKIDRRSGANRCSAIVAVSEHMRERLLREGGRSRVVHIPNGIDLARFTPNGAKEPDGTDGVVVGCAARLVDGKGVEDLMRALAQPSLAKTRLQIAGEGPNASALEHLGRSLGLEERMDLQGPVFDMPAFWRSIDIGVVPSNGLVESFGISAIEAMACAKPVVVTDSGALPDVIDDGATGTVVRAGDVTGLAEAIGRYASNPALRLEHGANGRRRCEERFSIQETASRYLELCRELIRPASDRRS
jgi:glycosyltransferase involved in cell wall biosynthesis